MKYPLGAAWGRWVQVVVLVLATLVGQAQAPQWAQAVTMANGPSRVMASAADGAGNVFIAGVFAGTVSLDGFTFNSAGDSDVFVAKWSEATSRFVWVQRAGGTGLDDARAIAVAGNAIYVAGDYVSAATFGSTTLAGSSNSKAFVCKLLDMGSSGSFAWAVRAGGNGNNVDIAQAVAVVGPAVYVAGRFGSAVASFGGIDLNNAAPGRADGFVAKLTDAGGSASFSWAERVGGTDNDEVTALAVVGPNIYATGFFAGTAAEFGPQLQMSTNGGSDGFVSKLTDAGAAATFAWTARMGGDNADQALALVAAGTAVYVTGYFTSSYFYIGSQGPQNSGTGTADMFVARLDDAGTTGQWAWATRTTGSGTEVGTAIAVKGNGVYVGGNFDGAMAGFGTTMLSSTGQRDMVLTKLTDTGTTATFDWARAAGGSGSDSPATVALGGTRVYVGGSVTPPASFGSITVPLTGGVSPAACWAWLADRTLAVRPAVAVPLMVFPSPAQGSSTVHLPVRLGVAPATLTLLDALGRAVRSETVALATYSTEHSLDLTGLTPGLYLLRLVANGSTATQRLVVE